MATWYGLWHGGSGYALSDPENDMEQFGTLQEAKDALHDRYHDGYSFRQRFDYVNREPENVLTPAVSDDSCIHLFASPDADPSLPDRHMYFGPRGGIRTERLWVRRAVRRAGGERHPLNYACQYITIVSRADTTQSEESHHART